MSVYQEVTDRIIKALENGTVPWRMPWTVRAPENYFSHRKYTGVNVMLLALAGKSTPYWASFNQIQQLGGMVKEGEKGTRIVFMKAVPKKPKDDEDAEEVNGFWHVFREWSVFNLDQTTGIDIPKPNKADFKPVEAAEKIVSGYQNPPMALTGRPQACYVPALDTIEMPNKEDFDSVEDYYSTLFHEMTHSTGHEKRLKRFELITPTAMFGSESYSKEELVAEIGASFLMGHAGMTGTEKNSEAYIAGWLKKLQDDKKLVISAAAKAQKAAEHILG